MDLHSVQKIYKVFSIFYDLPCSTVLRPGRIAAIRAMELKPGDHVLEVGVGTGLQLPLYPRSVHVVGIDICQEMLCKAIKRKKQMNLNHVELHRMDAMNISLNGRKFDAVMAAHVISVVPDPHRAVGEMVRHLKPGGTIVFLNHTNDGNEHVSRFKQMITPITERIGFRSDLDVAALARECGLEILHEQRVNVLKLWSVVKCRPKNAEAEEGNG